MDDTLIHLCNEVSSMNNNDLCRLRSLWRNRYGYEYAEASIFEMAVELGIERGMLLTK